MDIPVTFKKTRNNCFVSAKKRATPAATYFERLAICFPHFSDRRKNPTIHSLHETTLPPIIMEVKKKDPSNSSYLSKTAIFQFHDYGRKSNSKFTPENWAIWEGQCNIFQLPNPWFSKEKAIKPSVKVIICRHLFQQTFLEFPAVAVRQFPPQLEGSFTNPFLVLSKMSEIPCILLENNKLVFRYICISILIQCLYWKKKSRWWFQPISKNILVKLDPSSPRTRYENSK